MRAGHQRLKVLALPQGVWEVGVRDGRRRPPAVPQGTGVHEELLGRTVPHCGPSGGNAALGRSLLVSEGDVKDFEKEVKGNVVLDILCSACPAIGASSGR